VQAHCAFDGTTALVEIVNRRGSVVQARVRGVEPRAHVITIDGNATGAFPFTVTPGAEVEILLADNDNEVLFQGTAPTEPDPRSTDGQYQRPTFAFPGSGPFGADEHIEASLDS